MVINRMSMVAPLLLHHFHALIHLLHPFPHLLHHGGIHGAVLHLCRHLLHIDRDVFHHLRHINRADLAPRLDEQHYILRLTRRDRSV